MNSQYLKYILLFFLSLTIFLFKYQPTPFFCDGKPKKYGWNKNETPIPYYTFSFLVSLLLYVYILHRIKK